jgi:hypothetical protein
MRAAQLILLEQKACNAFADAQSETSITVEPSPVERLWSPRRLPSILQPVATNQPGRSVMPFHCPTCNIKLRENYNASKFISEEMHGKPFSCTAIGTLKGQTYVEMSKNQRKTKEREAGLAAAKTHKVDKSVRNLETYQTPARAPLQATRVESAKVNLIGGHGSATSNSKRNNSTNSGLNKVNGK